jgi:hypothetical protein
MIPDKVALPFPCSEDWTLDPTSYHRIAIDVKDIPRIQLHIPSFMQSGVSECAGRDYFHELYSCYRTDNRMVGMRVLVSHITYEIDPGMLMMACQQRLTASICNCREVFQPFGTELDLLCIEPRSGSTDLVTRNLCYKCGEYYVWFQAFCPRSIYPQNAGVLWDILRSCTVEDKLGEYAESMAYRSLAWQSGIEFVVPTRCRIVRTEVSEELCHVSIESEVHSRVFSRVGIVVSSKKSFSQLYERAGNILRVLGANCSKLEILPLSYADGRFRRICEETTMSLADMELSYQAMAINCASYNVWIENLGVRRQDSVFWWLVSQRTYQLSAWSLKIGSEIVIRK